MRYKALIIRIADNVERFRDMGEGIPWDDSSYFWWTEGNFGCDCNRHLEFGRAGNPPEAEKKLWADEIHCGNNLYRVPYVVLADGRKIEIDGDAQ